MQLKKSVFLIFILLGRNIEAGNEDVEESPMIRGFLFGLVSPLVDSWNIIPALRRWPFHRGLKGPLNKPKSPSKGT